jgi:TolB-like protein
MAATAQALDDSLHKTLVRAGYTLATSDELVRLLGQNDLGAQRRIADEMGIGAIVMTILVTRGSEVAAQSIVMDVWRGYPFSDHTAADRDKPQELLGMVRDVSRDLERVSWRTRADPKRVVVFDIENQTGNESVNDLARQLSDSLRIAVRRRFGAEVVTDTLATAVKDMTERRAVGARLGAGAIMAGTLFRARGDSVTLRLSTRDMSEDRTFPNVDVRATRGELLSSFQGYVDRLLADLGQVNWGPKASRQ